MLVVVGELHADDNAIPVSAVTDVGRQRTHNEDAFLVRPDLALYAVADGMGGHRAGDVASATTTLALTSFFEGSASGDWDRRFSSEDDMLLPGPASRLAAAVRKANADVFEASRAQARNRGMGTTVVALHAAQPCDFVHIAHVGDSRCYRLRGDKLEQLTNDHSLANEALMLDPSLDQADIALLPTNIITRALGMESRVQVDVRTVEIEPSDLFLLCSDGLSETVTESEIVQVIRLVDSLGEATELLVALANDAGGHDNITAVLVQMPS